MQADARFQDAAKQTWDLIVLPGGDKSAETMRDCTELIGMLSRQKASGKLVGATGTTPSVVLASIRGFLQNGATCYPINAFRKKMPNPSDNDVVVHGNVVTSQGIGQVFIFGIMLVELLHDAHLADLVASSMVVYRPGYKYRYDPPLFEEEEEGSEGKEEKGVEEEEGPEAHAAMNGNSGNEKQTAPTETLQAVKESNVENAGSQIASNQMEQPRGEAETTGTRDEELESEQQESSSVQGEQFNEDSDRSRTSASDKQTEIDNGIHMMGSETASSRDSQDSDGSWHDVSASVQRKRESSSNAVESLAKKRVCYDVEEVPIDKIDHGIGEAAYRQEEESNEFDPDVDDRHVLDDSVDTNISDDELVRGKKEWVDSTLRRTSLLDDSSKDSVSPARLFISHNDFPIPDDDLSHIPVDDDGDDDVDRSPQDNSSVQLSEHGDNSSRCNGSIGGLSVEGDETSAKNKTNVRRKVVIDNSQTKLTSPHIKDMLEDTSDIVLQNRVRAANRVAGQEEPVTRVLGLRNGKVSLPYERLLARPNLGDDGTLDPQLLEVWYRSTSRVTGDIMPFRMRREAGEERGEENFEQRVHDEAKEEGVEVGRSARDRESEGEAQM
jgi:hypothetical protein